MPIGPVASEDVGESMGRVRVFRRWSRWSAGSLIFALLSTTAVACGGPDYSGLTRSERFFQRYRHESDSRLAKDLRTWVSRDTGISWDDVWPRVNALAQWGVRRMPDSTVLELVGHWLELAGEMDTTLCAEWVAGGLDSVQAKRVARLADSTSLEWTVRYRVRAALAEIRDQPAPRQLNRMALQDAYRATAEHLPPKELERLTALLNARSPRSVGPSDRCWAMRRLMELTRELDSPQRETVARLVAYPRRSTGSGSSPSR